MIVYNINKIIDLMDVGLPFRVGSTRFDLESILKVRTEIRQEFESVFIVETDLFSLVLIIETRINLI